MPPPNRERPVRVHDHARGCRRVHAPSARVGAVAALDEDELTRERLRAAVVVGVERPRLDSQLLDELWRDHRLARVSGRSRVRGDLIVLRHVVEARRGSGVGAADGDRCRLRGVALRVDHDLVASGVDVEPAGGDGVAGERQRGVDAAHERDHRAVAGRGVSIRANPDLGISVRIPARQVGHHVGVVVLRAVVVADLHGPAGVRVIPARVGPRQEAGVRAVQARRCARAGERVCARGDGRPILSEDEDRPVERGLGQVERALGLATT